MEDLIKLLGEEIEAEGNNVDEEERKGNRKKIGAILGEAIKGTALEKEIEELSREARK